MGVGMQIFGSEGKKKNLPRNSFWLRCMSLLPPEGGQKLLNKKQFSSSSEPFNY